MLKANAPEPVLACGRSMFDYVLAPSARGAWQPSRGLRSRDGANPEKKIATDLFCGVHITVVGAEIGEVKTTLVARQMPLKFGQTKFR
ncbi:MAG: hypothetical protein E5X67_01580 [Mesorhizobium sp.]|uniref:hypothetical protein n=1 Tax=Mesorhizobium sp. TaxID=1871066 RepID=UPI0012275DB5|nr:hypothetical protein [Mesorhizobium sp.]TIP30538.1 MAG: hypothetical protein E5X67_01580 [Mesorhizobium sp.]